MDTRYVEQRDGGYWIADTRVSLDSVVYAFRDGLSPETIQQEYFPIISLEQVYGAIAYYLANRGDIDAYLEQTRQEYELLREISRQTDPIFYKKLTHARKQMQTTK